MFFLFLSSSSSIRDPILYVLLGVKVWKDDDGG